MDENLTLNHSVIIENRKKLSVLGVRECLGFDEETIALNTALGRLTIKGTGLHILNFDTDSGDLTAEGRIHAVVYITDQKNGGFLNRIFK